MQLLGLNSSPSYCWSTDTSTTSEQQRLCSTFSTRLVRKFLIMYSYSYIIIMEVCCSNVFSWKCVAQMFLCAFVFYFVECVLYYTAVFIPVLLSVFTTSKSLFHVLLPIHVLHVFNFLHLSVLSLVLSDALLTAYTICKLEMPLTFNTLNSQYVNQAYFNLQFEVLNTKGIVVFLLNYLQYIFFLFRHVSLCLA